MHRHDLPNVHFVNRFIDCVTIRPFLDDLRKAKRVAEQLPIMPRVISRSTQSTEAA